MPEPRTPLRRVSRGSLSALSRSGSFPDAPTSLGFLQVGLAGFADETETLGSNLERLKELEESLKEFNEGFASYLYAMKMNAFVTEWHQTPSDESFILAKERREKEASTSASATRDRPRTPLDRTVATDDATASNESTFHHLTSADQIQLQDRGRPTSASSKKVIVKKKGGKPVLSAKEKKERSMIIEKTCNALPLEFRGSDPDLRRNAETVIIGLLEAADAKSDGVKITDLVQPGCPQARVNKCLIALLSRKIINKSSNAGLVLYSWVGLAQT